MHWKAIPQTGICNNLNIGKMQQSRVFYYDSSCLLIVNHSGKIRKLYTPFKVLCTDIHLSFPHLKLGLTMYVEEVYEDENDLLLYLINRRKFPYHYFQIVVYF